MPEPKNEFETITRYHHWQDERDKRLAMRQNLDEALLGVVPPGGTAAITPSSLLYGGRADWVQLQWDQRWWTARLIELGHFAISEFLSGLGRGLSCRRERGDLASLLARYLGFRVHQVIQRRYLQARKGNRISLDNRVSTLGTSEQLSRLASENPHGEFATLNFSLAGGRADIVDFSTREMFEIKPAALASEAVLQLWAYLDNHEVARTFNGLVEDGGLVPALDVGDVTTLPPSITEPFSIQLRGIKVPLAIQPYTVNRLPGLILYTVGIDVRQDRQAAAAAMALGRTSMNDLLVAAGRNEQQRREAGERPVHGTARGRRASAGRQYPRRHATGRSAPTVLLITCGCRRDIRNPLAPRITWPSRGRSRRLCRAAGGDGTPVSVPANRTACPAPGPSASDGAAGLGRTYLAR